MPTRTVTRGTPDSYQERARAKSRGDRMCSTPRRARRCVSIAETYSSMAGSFTIAGSPRDHVELLLVEQGIRLHGDVVAHHRAEVLEDGRLLAAEGLGDVGVDAQGHRLSGEMGRELPHLVVDLGADGGDALHHAAARAIGAGLAQRALQR